MDIEKQYQTYQPLLFSLAYRMLGSVMDAEDIVQEAFLLMKQNQQEVAIENEKAYLCKIVTNRCLNLLQSSAKQREVYVGTWLPEPLVKTERAKQDPSEVYLQKESISTAYLLLLQQLSAVERAIFLLREIFQYTYHDIAEMVGKSSTNCRQIFHRAKKSIHHKTPSKTISSNLVNESQVQQFIKALLEGDMKHLMDLITQDVVHYSDGGGKAHALFAPVRGMLNVLKLYKDWFETWFKHSNKKFSYSITQINGNPGCIMKVDNQVSYVYSFAFRNNRIRSIYVVANPDKLEHLNSSKAI